MAHFVVKQRGLCVDDTFFDKFLINHINHMQNNVHVTVKRDQVE